MLKGSSSFNPYLVEGGCALVLQQMLQTHAHTHVHTYTFTQHIHTPAHTHITSKFMKKCLILGDEEDTCGELIRQSPVEKITKDTPHVIDKVKCIIIGAYVVRRRDHEPSKVQYLTYPTISLRREG